MRINLFSAHTLIWLFALTFLFSPAKATAQPNGVNGVESTKEYGNTEFDSEEAKDEPIDLTLWNLFSAGWRDKFEARSRRGVAPRMHLFTTRQPFLDREVRTNFTMQKNAKGGTEDEYELEMEVELPFNRRFMLNLEPSYTWIDGQRGEPDREGPGVNIEGFLQLVDTRSSTYNFQFGVSLPSRNLDLELSKIGEVNAEQNQTKFNFILAGFEDLTDRGLYRTGTLFHVAYSTLVGPGDSEKPRNALSYGWSLVKTLTDPDARALRDFSLFIEVFGVTALDGSDAGRTGIGFTPGLRWNMGSEENPWWLMAGVDIPVTGPSPFDYTFLISVIHWLD